MIFEKGQKVTSTTDEGCIFEVIERLEGSRTKYLCKDVTPDGEQIWHQKPEGGAYVTQFINGFRDEEFIFHKKTMTKA